MTLADQAMVRLARSHAGSLKYLEKQGRYQQNDRSQPHERLRPCKPERRAAAN